MNQRAIVMTIILFTLIVVGMFVFAFLKQKEINDVEETTNPALQGEVDPYADIVRVDGKHFYIDGVHTVVGEFALPTPCDLLESTARIAESDPEQITLDFSVINHAEFCAQVITAQRFKVSAAASEDATFSAIFQNRVIDFNLIEALEGETPEEFELFFKG